MRWPAGRYVYLGEYVHNFKKMHLKNVTVILAPRLKKWYVDHVDHMWTIFQPAPNIHVDRLVHMIHICAVLCCGLGPPRTALFFPKDI
eukprot:COSAG01_NODE_41_length_32446_cov_41.218877_14_plen_88_part_00